MIFPLQVSMDSNVKKKIFIIEDNIETQLIFKVYLRENFDVDLADNAEKGIEMLEANNYDLLLLDINLPGKLSGEDVLRHLQNRPSGKNVKVIVITAYALKGDRERYLEMGADAFMSKPVDKRMLLNKISEILNK